MSVLDFAIIGAQKSASTFLQNCMREHPDIWMPVGETPYFQTPDYEHARPLGLESIIGCHPNRKVGIKRPDYLGRAEVPERIATEFPQIRLIAILRDPVDRAIAAWYHYIKSGFLPAMHVEQGLRLVFDDPTFCKRFPISKNILEYGRYAEQLSRYNEFLAQEQMLVMLQEDLVQDPVESISRAFAHVEVDSGFRPHKSLGRRPQAVIYNLPRLRVYRFHAPLLFHYNQDRSRILGRTQNPFRFALGTGIRAFDRFMLRPLFGNKKPEITRVLRSRLAEYYEPTVRRLHEDFGLGVNRWLEKWATPS